MIKKLSILILFAVFFFESSNAQTFQKTDWGINATTDSFAVDIQFYSPSNFNIVIVVNGKGARDITVDEPDKVICYEGEKVAVKFWLIRLFNKNKLENNTGMTGRE